jgi:U4/U6 small nuclear ribonucleoprotein PRP3
MSHEPDIVVKQQRKRDRAESPLPVAATKKIRASDGHRDRHYHEDEPQEMGSKRNSRSEKKQEHREQQQRDREGLKAKYEGGGSYETVGKQDHHHHMGHDRKERVSGGRGTEEVHSERGHLEDVKPEYFDSKEVSGDQKHSARHGEAQRDRESRGNRHHSKDISKDNNNSRREREDPKSRDEKDRIRKIEKYSDSAAVSADNEHKRDRESKEKDGHRVLKRKEPRTDEAWEKQEKRLRSTHDEDNHDKQQPDTGLSPQMVTINGSSAKDKKDGNGIQVSSNGKTVDMPDSLKASVLPGIVSVDSPNSVAPSVSMPGGQHTSVMGSTDNAGKSHASTPSDEGVPQNASKSEARGEAAPAEKTSTVSLDALAKAKRVLQVQKELAEKLKKLPQLKKSGAETTTALPSTSAVPLAAASLPQAPPTLPPVLPTPPVLPLPGSIPPGIASGAFFNMPGMLPGLGGLGIPNLGSISNYEAVKRAHEFAVQLGFHQLPGGMPFMPTMVPTPGPDDMGGQPGQPKTVKAPVLRLDAQGREIDEHGNVVDRPKLTNVSTLKV